MTQPVDDERQQSEPLRHAVIALASYCADSEFLPNTTELAVIAEQLVRERRLDPHEREELLSVVGRFMALHADDDATDEDLTGDDATNSGAKGGNTAAEWQREQEPSTTDVAPSAETVRSPRRAWWRRVSRWGRSRWILFIVVCSAVILPSVTTAPRCVGAASTAPPGLAALICRSEYLQTDSPSAGALLAELLQLGRHNEEARDIAERLLLTPARGDAYRVLGFIALDENHFEEAVSAFETARTLHRKEDREERENQRGGHRAGYRVSLAHDDQALAYAQATHGLYKEALLTVDECITETRNNDCSASSCGQVELYCRFVAGRVLGRLGEYDLARLEFDNAESLAVTDSDGAQLAFERGSLDQSARRSGHRDGFQKTAVAEFERALLLSERAGRRDLVVREQLAVAYSLSELGQVAEATRHLGVVALLDVEHDLDAERQAVEARIAYHSGRFAEAVQLSEHAYQLVRDDDGDGIDTRIAIAAFLAEIALAQNDLDAAMMWAHRGIDQVERVRTMQPVMELRSSVLSSRREPYELLFVALVRAHRYEDALIALDQWQGRSLRDMAASPAMSLDLKSAAHRLETISTWLPTIDRAAFAKPVDRAAVLEVLRTIDLLALVVADGQVWRVVANHGFLRIDDMGSMSSLEDGFNKLTVEGNTRLLSDELGNLLIPDELFRETGEPLHVLLDGPLAKLPIPALAHAGRPLIAARPIVRVTSLPDTACVPAPPAGQAVVIGDPSDDLPYARREAVEISRLLKVRPLIGRMATADALLAAGSASLVHIAAHSNNSIGGGMLKLADRDVSAMEIAARKLGPSLVVLMSGASAMSNGGDLELANSLATAFLAAGSRQVVATLRPITDMTGMDLSVAFYQEGGAADPVRALATVQARLAKAGSGDWANFAVFGHDVCRSATN